MTGARVTVTLGPGVLPNGHVQLVLPLLPMAQVPLPEAAAAMGFISDSGDCEQKSLGGLPPKLLACIQTK